MASISLKQIQKSFGEVEVVKGLDLEIPNGQFTVLVGPSGCGKTTTLRMIAGLETVDSGVIQIGDKDVTKLEPKNRDVAMVFQNYALYAHLSVADNIGFPLKSKGIKKEEINARVAEVASSLGILDLLRRKPKELSGGQQQRVAIGRAIIRNPQVFLFDEPLSNLDAKLRLEMRTEIIRLQRRLGTTAVYVTHDQEEAMTLSDVMVVMKDGVIKQLGKPDDIYKKPKDVFVAEFVGSPKMNLVKGRASAGEFISESGFQIKVDPIISGEITLGIRPEDVKITNKDASSTQGKIEILEQLGPRAILTIQSGNQQITAVVDNENLKQITDKTNISINSQVEDQHYFETSTGKRLN
ncbi:MAG: sn-glycerol-3-phosphate ABC transporter ATP-binding protein UgpC [Actinobacteria bacterium]|nr:sn-glycerol-3-phosphate ABC transporter ATP-binding protein UgpC [Actinomycetota bacterium]